MDEPRIAVEKFDLQGGNGQFGLGNVADRTLDRELGLKPGRFCGGNDVDDVEPRHVDRQADRRIKPGQIRDCRDDLLAGAEETGQEQPGNEKDQPAVDRFVIGFDAQRPGIGLIVVEGDQRSADGVYRPGIGPDQRTALLVLAIGPAHSRSLGLRCPAFAALTADHDLHAFRDRLCGDRLRRMTFRTAQNDQFFGRIRHRRRNRVHRNGS